MLYKLWEKIKLLLPYILIVNMHKSKNTIGKVIKLQSGNELIPIMITSEYGILIMRSNYDIQRAKKLKKTYEELNKALYSVKAELDNLSFSAKEELFNNNEQN